LHRIVNLQIPNPSKKMKQYVEIIQKLEEGNSA